MFKKILFVACFMVSCGNEFPCYGNAYRPELTNFDIKATASSPNGLQISDELGQIDLVRLDALTADTLDCLQKIAPLTQDEVAQAWCGRDRDLQIRQCLVVAVAPKWRVSSCTGNQVFTCNVPDQSCLNKGEVPNPECPCSCRATLQKEEIIVTAPNLELYPGKLVELLTGCDQIWGIERLAWCGRAR